MKRKWGNESPDQVLHCKNGGVGQESVNAHFFYERFEKERNRESTGWKKV